MPHHRAVLRGRGELRPQRESNQRKPVPPLPRPDASRSHLTHPEQTSHIASLMKLPLPRIEDKLSQMILDKKFRGTLDAGAGCLIVYEDQTVDSTYEQALETLTNMGRVVDALYVKAGKLASTSTASAAGAPGSAPVVAKP